MYSSGSLAAPAEPCIQPHPTSQSWARPLGAWEAPTLCLCLCHRPGGGCTSPGGWARCSHFSDSADPTAPSRSFLGDHPGSALRPVPAFIFKLVRGDCKQRLIGWDQAQTKGSICVLWLKLNCSGGSSAPAAGTLLFHAWLRYKQNHSSLRFLLVRDGQ